MLREATLRGLRCLLVEQGDFAQGSSSRSSRLVHGGVRYLEEFDFRLVIESTRERARLWNLSPDLVKPLGFVFPGYKNSRHSLGVLNLGLWLYDSLALFRLPSLHRKLNRQKTLELIPSLRSDQLKGSIFYWDAQTHDSYLTLANLIDAVSEGAMAVNQTRLDKIQWSSNPGSEAHLVVLRDHLTQKTITTQARSIVFAGGPWTDHLAQERLPGWINKMSPTRGSHLVFSQSRFPLSHAVVHFHPHDGRVLFSIPWGQYTICGTTDIFDDGDPANCAIWGQEVEYLLTAANHDFPSLNLSKDDVVSTWCGIRPLVKHKPEESESEISRDHYLEWFDCGAVVISGGKLTTHREMADQTLDLLIDESRSWDRPLPQVCESPTLLRPLAPVLRFDPDGKKIGLSEAALTEHQIRGICQETMPIHLTDFMIRRTDYFYKETNNGWNLLETLEPILKHELGWDSLRWIEEKKSFAVEINRHIREPLGRPLIAWDDTVPVHPTETKK